MKKIAIILNGEIKYDGRVQKEINSLSKEQFEINLIVSRFSNDKFENYRFNIYNCDIAVHKNPVVNFINKFEFCKKAYKLMKKIKPDIIHCNDLDTLYAGILYKRHGNIRLIYDAHELFPESKEGIIRKFVWNMVERRYIKSIDEVISTEKNRAIYMKKKYKLEKINVIENLPMKPKLNSRNYIEENIPCTIGKRKILYIGALAKSRLIHEFVCSAKHIPNDYCLILIGKFDTESYRIDIEKLIENNNLNHKVYILKPIENKEVINYINSADIGLVFYKNNNLNNFYCASNKLYEFIVCDKKVITNDYPGLIEVVKQNNYGVCLNEVNEGSVAKAIIEIKNLNFGNKNIGNYYWETQNDKFLNIYKQF